MDFSFCKIKQIRFLLKQILGASISVRSKDLVHQHCYIVCQFVQALNNCNNINE